MSDEQDFVQLCEFLGQFSGIIPGEYVAEDVVDGEAGEGTVELQLARTQMTASLVVRRQKVWGAVCVW